MSQQPSPIASSNSTSCASSMSLARALDQNEGVRDAVEQSAAELVVINAVLKHEIPEHIQVNEVAEALLKTDELEGRINDTVGELAEVNQVLEHEIGQRNELEQELAATKAALAKAKAEIKAAS